MNLEGRALDLKTLAEELVVLKSSDVYGLAQLDSLNLAVAENNMENEEKGIEFSVSFSLDNSVINYQNNKN